MNSAEKAAQAAKKEQQDKIKKTFVKAEAICKSAQADGKKWRSLLKKAAKLFTVCAKAGHAESMGWLAVYYDGSDYVYRNNYTNVHKNMFSDCWHYCRGNDRKKAYYWCTKGAEAGDLRSLYILSQDGWMAGSDGDAKMYRIKLNARLSELYMRAKKLLIQCVDNCSEYCNEFNIVNLTPEDSALFYDASDMVTKCVKYSNRFNDIHYQITEMTEKRMNITTLKDKLERL